MSSDEPTSRVNDTIGRRLEKYARFQKLTIYLGGGLGGLVLFGDLAKDVFLLVPDWLRAAFIAAALVTGGCIGYAYSGFQWAETLLQRELDDNHLWVRSSKISEVAGHEWPTVAYVEYNLAPALIGLTALLLLIAAVWSVVAPY
ncbi:hypothetical protein D5S18_29595 [Nocardia panacis]|uniref:Uncharacterized protein n=1 Tax=Nocardia panacis TaxID=2340916 RepID=A0A3A4KBL9_9NOCA|nr:hypothetical protein [Nocardia panacis]RJO70018.1 hypothetical protein D5S18_29595 [Nocardia panacis]